MAQPVVQRFVQRIGLVGGTGWPATRDYYELINRMMQARLGRLHGANLLIWSFDFQEVLDSADVPGAVDQKFLHAGRALQHAGAEILALASNTGHLFLKAWQQADLPLVHISEACAKALAQKNVKRVGILATQRACQGGVFDAHFEAVGISLVYPDAQLAKLLDDAIFGELEIGKPGVRTGQALLQAAEQFTKQGVSDVLLGCTELRLALMPQELLNSHPALRFWDSTEIHCAAIVDAAFAYTTKTVSP